MAIRNVIGAAALALMAGCASSGTMVTANQAAQFEKGKATRAQVIAQLGQPNASTVLNDGTQIDVYVHAYAAANGASYVPVVGLLAGGASGTTNTATFTFGKDGVLKAVTTSSGQAQSKTGLLNQ